MSKNDAPDGEGISLFSVFKSVLAAGFGVQKEENRIKDFQQGKAVHFIVAGLIATLLFLLLVWGLVQLVLMGAQS